MLDARQRKTVQALGDTLFPSVAAGDPSGGDILPDALDQFLPALASEKQKGVLLLLNILDVGAIFRYGRRFSRLAPAKRTRYLDGWMRSRLAFRRIVYRAIRELCGTLYYQDERTWSNIGYDGPPVAKTREREVQA